MRKTFFRTLAAVAIVQFIITRAAAGRTIEEGRAERMWMMYPLDVAANTVAWMLLFTVISRGRRIFHRA